MAGNEPRTNRPAGADPGELGVLTDNEPTLPEHMRLAQPAVQKRSVLSQPLVAVPIFVVLIAVGGFMVSSLEKVPVPSTLPEAVEEAGPTQFERQAAAQEVLEGLNLDGVVAYVSVRGVSTVDLSNGDVDDVRTDATVGPGPYVVMPADDRWFVVDVAEPSQAAVVETNGEIVTTATDGRFVVVDSGSASSGSEGSRAIQVVDWRAGSDPAPGDIVVSDELAEDTVYRPIHGVGVIVEQSDGSSVLYAANGPGLLSDHPVVAIGGRTRVEVRCSDTCSAFLVGGGGEIELPDAFSAARLDHSSGLSVSISPDGRWLLLYGAGQGDDPDSGSRPAGVGAQLFDVESGQLFPVSAGKAGSPAWSEDSAKVVWLDPRGNDARLVVVDVDDRSVTVVDLDALGAPNRDGDTLVLLPRP